MCTDSQYSRFQEITRLPPPGSCDTQAHVFGDVARFPPRKNSAYAPNIAADVDAWTSMRRAVGLDRGVVVQSAIYGTDSRILIDALSRVPNIRGVAIIDNSVSDVELERLHSAGVRGARFNFWKSLNVVPEVSEFRRSIERIASFGWVAKIHAFRDEWLDLRELLSPLKLPVVIDHMGHVSAAAGGRDHPVYRLLIDLLGRENWWMMISNSDRVATHPEWEDMVPIVRGFVEAAPNRTIWCTDWPHVRYEKPVPPTEKDLLNFLYRCLPEPSLQHRVLVDNPARLFGF